MIANNLILRVLLTLRSFICSIGTTIGRQVREIMLDLDEPDRQVIRVHRRADLA